MSDVDGDGERLIRFAGSLDERLVAHKPLELGQRVWLIGTGTTATDRRALRKGQVQHVATVELDECYALSAADVADLLDESRRQHGTDVPTLFDGAEAER
jgi:hypothetical protein